MYLVKDKKQVMPLIEEDLIVHLNTLGRMMNNKDIEIYVDNVENPRGFVLKHGYWAIPYSRDKEILDTVLKTYSFGERVGFCGLPTELANTIRGTLWDYELEWEEHCYLYYLPENNWKKIQAEETLGYLKPEDVDVVNHYYTYKEEGSREYLLECIINRPSSVIRDEKGNPISWALVREDNSMGVMYTIEEYRKKGFAKRITVDLLKKVIDKGNIPYNHIVVTNSASQNLAIEMGFQCWGNVLWFGLTKKNKD
ncbi:GNAT family N-acetyltransferase [Alkaliphilus hydrothermalis]|uniref:N-acetyltransferase domain-containing protein n=1 Tax=Alkaliphilus hydrothermalis TaxID=1482730 RepID=A0ABS2NTS7_9FIRM|nr:GNAT family N-acetyltransferase [Alkaliphilus hydrothermalis]MBM7616384.1 hypothetical protein [Alkaliphilus hydrothermalis]